MGLMWLNYPQTAEARTVAPLYFSYVHYSNACNMLQEKKCLKCGETKSISEFYKNKTKKYGIQSSCKYCEELTKTNFKRTPIGLSSYIYSHQIKSSRYRNHPLPTYTREEFIKWSLASPEFHRLYNEWVRSGYDKWSKPSFDRRDDGLPYTFDNFNKWMTWQENSDKAHEDSKTGKLVTGKPHRAIIGTNIKTGKEVEFHSTMEVERQLGIYHNMISKCCLGKQLSAGEYTWKYKS